MTTLSIGQLLQENEDLRQRLEEAEDAFRALRAGEVDAVLVEGPIGCWSSRCPRALRRSPPTARSSTVTAASPSCSDGRFTLCSASRQAMGRTEDEIKGELASLLQRE